MNIETTQILIAGSGPVGMTLALELAHHGIRSVIVERNATTTKHPKMDLTNGRSMELLRRLGIADDLRAVGVHRDEALDVVWATSASGHVLQRFAYPSPAASAEMTRVRNDGTGTVEPSMRVSQIVLEPVLKGKMDAHPLIDVRFGCGFESFVQDDEAVIATVRSADADKISTIRADYLVGCDGGGSRVRQIAKIALSGDHAIAQAYMVHFQSTAHDVLAKFGVVYHLQTALGTIISQNGNDVWTLQALAPPDADPDELLQRFVGEPFEYAILVANAWTPHMVLADQYRSGRVFLAGDSAHQVIPTGGYGMNTGVGDAVDLGWKLAAVAQGWGGDRLLDSYETERRQIAVQNRAAALTHIQTRLAIIQAIEEAGAGGDLNAADAAGRRLTLSRQIAQFGNAENESWGIEHGYCYAGSPVIQGGEAPVKFDPLHCSSGAVAGMRLPSVYLADGRALLDLLGFEITLIIVGDHETHEAEEAAAKLNMPLTLVRLEPEPVLDLLIQPLLLVRPDHHVAWMGAAPAPSWLDVLKRISGADTVQGKQELAA